MKLAYQAFDRAGKAVTDTIDAVDSLEATERLRKQGLFVASIEVKEDAVSTSRPTSRRPNRAPKVRLKNLAMFTRQLQVLTSTGTPLVQGLSALERQSQQPSWRQVITDVRQRVEEGASLADALLAHPRCFDPIYRSLVMVGESSGKIDLMLGRLGALTRQQLRVRSSVIGTMIYPCLLMLVAGFVLVLMLGFILPRFAGLYESLDAPLPPSTKLLMWLSEMGRIYWWAGAIALVGLGLALKMFLVTPVGKRTLDMAMVRLPQLGRITRSFATARITRVLGILVESRVPLLEALQLTKQSAGNIFFAEILNKAEESVTRGESVSSAFAGSNLINPWVTEAIRTGEQTGQIGPLLLSIADFLDEENDVVIKSLTSIVEPLILIVLGVMVGLIALAMFLPLFDLTAMTSGSGGGG